MIRTARLNLLGKNYFNIPIFSQRATNVPRQMLVEFSAFAEKEKEKESKSSKLIPDPPDFSANRQEEPNNSFHAGKSAFLRDILSDDLYRGNKRFSSDLKYICDNTTSLTPPVVAKVLKLLSRSNNRPVATLKALCSALQNEKYWQYTEKECGEILCSLAKLSYKDHDVVQLIADQLKMLSLSSSSQEVGFMLLSLGDLRYRDTELLDKLLKYVLNNNPIKETLLHCLRAAGLLNYPSPEIEEMMQILGKLKPGDFAQSNQFINFIWSCIILNKQQYICMEHLSTILSENFASRLINNGAYISVKMKLLNINAAARHIESYKGTFLDNYGCYKLLSLSIPGRKSSFLLSVLDTLSHIVPNGLVKPFVNTGAGFYLDVFYLEKTEKSSRSQNNNNSKIGILLANFNDVCSDGTLTGMTMFKKNILRLTGYKTVVLRYSEYNPLDPLSTKMELLSEKLGIPIKKKD